MSRSTIFQSCQDGGIERKNVWDTKVAFLHLHSKGILALTYSLDRNDTNRLANTVDPHQTAPLLAV